MILELVELPADLHGPSNPDYKGRVPKRARFLASDAWQALRGVLQVTANKLIFTDIFRSAEASLQARAVKRGVQRPGYSAHNYGLAVDLDVDPTLKALGLKYPELLEVMGNGGWYCHRRDGDSEGMECWHFNFLGDESARYLDTALQRDPSTWGSPVETGIQERYGHEFDYGDRILQTYLSKLGFYNGEPDGIIGPNSRQAIAAFQRAWNIAEPGAGRMTRRTLAFVAAERRVSATF